MRPREKQKLSEKEVRERKRETHRRETGTEKKDVRGERNW